MGGRMYSSIWLFVLLHGAVLRLAEADLPVHCLANQAEGTWKFSLSAASANRPSCGHAHPDDPLREPRPDWTQQQRADLQVTLSLPSSAYLEGASDAEPGSWAMVGDEGFEVRIAGRQFFAFFGFEQLPTDIGSEHLPIAMQKRYSRCGKTMVGWWRSENRSEFGCYVAAKNEDSFLQLRSRKGAARRTAQQALRGRARQTVRTALPAAWDWRNVSGKSWVDPSVSQGLCGSCHTISTMQMLSARHRIASGDSGKDAFSVSFPLFCSEYNQGCGAGFPFLAAKWSEDVGLLPARCAPAYSPEGTCAATCGAESLRPEDRLRAANHRYVGGYIGAADSDMIMEELVERGPVVVSFRSAKELQDYTGGVFHFTSDAGTEQADLEDVTEGPQAFVGASHSAVLLGFGTSEDGEKYWILQNSWGADWGERGTFRFSQEQARQRGLEAMVVAADVVADDDRSTSGASGSVLSNFMAALSPASATAEAVLLQRAAVSEPAGQPTKAGWEVLCRAPGDPALVMKIDRSSNSRGFSLGNSVGTETKVVCNGALADGACAPPEDGLCASMESCPCDLHGSELPFAGMRTIVDKVTLMCTASLAPMRVLMIGLGGGAMSSAIADRCTASRASVESIELDPRVVDFASKFMGFAASDSNSIEVTDGFAAVKERSDSNYDAVVVDCFGSGDRVPEGCRSEEFLRHVRRLLKDDGLLMQNIWAHSAASEAVEADFATTKSAYAGVFQRQPFEEVITDVPQSKEEILYGLKGSKWESLFGGM
eukprot:TRINITY_DN112863_c0_g1_i1.p1 TRINITY_DN112863_c0_g1~~TRINITY_DN112863_c0_g1_i1.p1  ORF type:complete len:768 (-),score=165.45 TRINITY_DN112863_c0_g1_i1:48-2351(-)